MESVQRNIIENIQRNRLGDKCLLFASIYVNLNLFGDSVTFYGTAAIHKLKEFLQFPVSVSQKIHGIGNIFKFQRYYDWFL